MSGIVVLGDDIYGISIERAENPFFTKHRIVRIDKRDMSKFNEIVSNKDLPYPVGSFNVFSSSRQRYRNYHPCTNNKCNNICIGIPSNDEIGLKGVCV